MKSLLLHPGTQYSHHLACQLQRLECLYKFITGIAFTENNPLLRLLPAFLESKISNRILDCSIKGSQFKNIPIPELMALYRIFRGEEIEKVMHERNRLFQNSVRQKLLENAECVIGFDTSSWIIAEKVKKINKPYFLDQSIAHPREKEVIFDDLRIQYPHWGQDISKKNETQVNLEEQEYSLATKIVVASSFTKKSLLKHGVAWEKIIVNPYGVSTEFFRTKNRGKAGQRIRFLYLGIPGARKGLPFLLDVWKDKELHKVAELWIAGPSNTFALRFVEKVEGIAYLGKMPYKKIPSLLEACDCLVFPSFFEGFGLVILEAMAAGLPVITTEATAGPDIIEHAKDGFIIHPGDKQALSQCMLSIATDPALCYFMGSLAREKAKLFSWNAYGDRWKQILKSV